MRDAFRRFRPALFLAFWAGSLLCGRADTNQPASVPPGALDLQAPEYQTIREAYDKEKSGINGPRLEKLKGLLQRNLQEADAMLKEKEMTGNIKGMAIARETKAVFEEALSDLDKKQDFALPEKVRREVEPTVAECRQEKQRIDGPFTNRLANLEQEYLQKFSDAMRKNPQLVSLANNGDSVKKWFQQLLITEKASPSTPKPPTGPGATNVAATASNTAAAASEIFAKSGEAPKWMSVARWTADMVAVDIVSIPVTGRSGVFETEKYNPVAGQNSTLRYEALRRLPERGDYQFRLKRIPDKEPVDVLDWPAVKGGFVLTFRTHSGIVAHGFELEVGVRGADIARLFPDNGGASAAAATNLPSAQIKLNLKTKPDGASVSVDGVPYRDEKDVLLKTPCVVKLDPGRHTVQVSLLTYLDMKISDYDFKEDRDVSWVFRPDLRVTRATVVVPAHSDGWTASSVKIKPGDQVVIDASGKWVCGVKGEECGPDGYPNNKDFLHYYLNPLAAPRQLVGANYGALLVKINADGFPKLIGKGGALTTAKDGTLFFDINETEYKALRKNNTGAITVKVTVIPAPSAERP